MCSVVSDFDILSFVKRFGSLQFSEIMNQKAKAILYLHSATLAKR